MKLREVRPGDKVKIVQLIDNMGMSPFYHYKISLEESKAYIGHEGVVREILPIGSIHIIVDGMVGVFYEDEIELVQRGPGWLIGS